MNQSSEEVVRSLEDRMTGEAIFTKSAYRQPGLIGTEGMNRVAGLEPGETFSLCVFPASSPVPGFTPSVPIHPG